MEIEAQKYSILMTDQDPETQNSNSSQYIIADKIAKGTLAFLRK